MHGLDARDGLLVDLAPAELGPMARVFARVDVAADRLGVGPLAPEGSRLRALLAVEDVRLGDGELPRAHERDLHGVLDGLDVDDAVRERVHDLPDDVEHGALVGRAEALHPRGRHRRADFADVEILDGLPVALADLPLLARGRRRQRRERRAHGVGEGCGRTHRALAGRPATWTTRVKE